MTRVAQRQNTPYGQIIPLKSGSYGSLGTGGTTSNVLVNGTLRVAPIYLARTVSLTKIGLQVTVIGDAGSTIRLGIYGDTGEFYPGALVLDAGTIAGDSATVQEITIAQTLPKGVYWIGGAVQGVTVTQPTVRIVSGALSSAIDSTASGVTNAGNTAQSMTGVTGALPATFSSTPTASNLVPRMIWKIG